MTYCYERNSWICHVYNGETYDEDMPHPMKNRQGPHGVSPYLWDSGMIGYGVGLVTAS